VTAQHDLASCFDQFRLASTLWPLFSVGKSHVLTTLSMGFGRLRREAALQQFRRESHSTLVHPRANDLPPAAQRASWVP
jgi:hypothetical protein